MRLRPAPDRLISISSNSIELVSTRPRLLNNCGVAATLKLIGTPVPTNETGAVCSTSPVIVNAVGVISPADLPLMLPVIVPVIVPVTWISSARMSADDGDRRFGRIVLLTEKLDQWFIGFAIDRRHGESYFVDYISHQVGLFFSFLMLGARDDVDL